MTDFPQSVITAWHLVALSSQLREKPLRRMIAGKPIVLFRSHDRISALLDRCPHRNYPLANGKIVNGAIQCPYHGWKFGDKGECIEIPGCPSAAVDSERFSAHAFAVEERHGGLFVCISPDGAAEPDLPPLLGDHDHDHFWWAQGQWTGRAFDAVDNVLDPFHTNFIHDGFIRQSKKRMPVKLSVESFGDGIEMVIEQSAPDTGLMSRMLEPSRTRSVTRYYPPTTVQARWEGIDKLTLCVTAFFTPESEGVFRPFACFTTPKGRTPAWIKQAAIRLFLAPVVAQDRRALAEQYRNIKAFNGPHFTLGPGELMKDRPYRLYKGEKIPIGKDAPKNFDL